MQWILVDQSMIQYPKASCRVSGRFEGSHTGHKVNSTHNISGDAGIMYRNAVCTL